MTAPTDTRPSTDRLTLLGRLTRLAEHVQSVAETPSPTAGFAKAVLRHLEPALATAAIQADEIAMLRAQAADRERLRAIAQAVRAELDRLDAVLAADLRSPTAESARWTVKRLRDLTGSALAPVENLEESQL
jgi:hypothetical protein